MCHHLSVKGYFDYIIRIVYFKHSPKASNAYTGANLVTVINLLALERLKAIQFAVDHL